MRAGGPVPTGTYSFVDAERCWDDLDLDREKQELISRSARLAYPIRDGIPIMLEGEARAVPAEEIEAMPPRTPVLG